MHLTLFFILEGGEEEGGASLYKEIFFFSESAVNEDNYEVLVVLFGCRVLELL